MRFMRGPEQKLEFWRQKSDFQGIFNPNSEPNPIYIYILYIYIFNGVWMFTPHDGHGFELREGMHRAQTQV